MIETSTHDIRQFKCMQDILKELGSTIDPCSLILDFGCGEGRAVYQLRKNGLNAFGVDIEQFYDKAQKLCQDESLIKGDEDIFRTIDLNNYRIPFDANTFDFVMSEQVFEHVKNYTEALAEIKRVLKPGGTGLHILPSRYRPIEAHVLVPFGGMFQAKAYLAFWAFLGIRNSFQQRLNWKEVADLNFNYLRSCTQYFKKAEIRNLVTQQFSNISFVEALYIKHSSGRIHKYLSFISSNLPFISSLFSTFHSRVIFFKKVPEELLN